jgi:hypothetical protein
MYITIGGKLKVAPGLTQTGMDTWSVAGDGFGRIDRLVIYETLETPVKIYLVASIFKSSTWGCYYARFQTNSSGITDWTQVSTLRDVQNSTRPHELGVARGLCFIKAFPNSGGDKYGSIIFDGSGGSPSSSTWGIPHPTVAARIVSSGSWSASTNPVTVLIGWNYVYCWKDNYGQYSCRSLLETDPSVNPSNTGPFTNKKPQVVVQGNADTTNFPKIGIFRTLDGGGTFCFVEDITNTGAGNITYTDQHRVSSNTNDPMSDAQLDTRNIAPGPTTNLPPPPVGLGNTAGTTQVDPSTPMAYFARRWWYAIGNRIYFSGSEEITNGVPEESWPNVNGITGADPVGPGNWYIVKGQPRTLISGKNTLYITTSDEVLDLRGQDKTNFYLDSLVSDLAGAAGFPRAITQFRDGMFMLSQDLQIYGVIYGSDPVNISVPLGTSIAAAIGTSGNTDVFMEVFNQQGNMWLIVSVVDKSNSANDKQFIYDINRTIWFTPWTKQMSAMASGRFIENDQNTYLVVATWDGTTGGIATLDLGAFIDMGVGYEFDCTTNLFNIPAGNHVNQINRPAEHPMLSYLITERTRFTGDQEPSILYRLDEFSGALTTATPQDPLYVPQHTSWSLKWYPIQQVTQRVQMKIMQNPSAYSFEMQNIGFVFQPTAGA